MPNMMRNLASIAVYIFLYIQQIKLAVPLLELSPAEITVLLGYREARLLKWQTTCFFLKSEKDFKIQWKGLRLVNKIILNSTVLPGTI